MVENEELEIKIKELLEEIKYIKKYCTHNNAEVLAKIQGEIQSLKRDIEINIVLGLQSDNW